MDTILPLNAMLLAITTMVCFGIVCGTIYEIVNVISKHKFSKTMLLSEIDELYDELSDSKSSEKEEAVIIAKITIRKELIKNIQK